MLGPLAFGLDIPDLILRLPRSELELRALTPLVVVGLLSKADREGKVTTLLSPP